MFVALALVLFLILPDPWNVVGGVLSLASGVVEITYWQRRMKRDKVTTGVENHIAEPLAARVRAAIARRIARRLERRRAPEPLPVGRAGAVEIG